ncbi:MAG: HD-GYP domain-containing protein [Pirellulaceae bacterium]
MSLVYTDQTQSHSQANTDAEFAPLSDSLAGWFKNPFSIWDGEQGELLYHPADAPQGDTLLIGELVRQVVRRETPELIAECRGAVVLALPLVHRRQPLAAVACFALHAERVAEQELGKLLAMDAADAKRWRAKQDCWTPSALLQMGALAIEHLAALQRTEQLSDEIDKVSDNLAATYEEISLLHGVTQNLRLSSSDEDLGQLALDWLLECVGAEGVALQYLPVSEEGKATYRARTAPILLSSGECPLTSEQFEQLIEHLKLEPGCGPYVGNANVTASEHWPFPSVENLIVTPLAEGSNVFGWLAAFNHSARSEFGTVEASLLSSVSAILGIHSGNHELYRQQAEFLASVVRALTSAIDAKDPYTCGHSDRVARVSVRLAQELGVDETTINTLYMAGLLHDIGKIGIDDSVLRKPGRLTDAEYEHIKLHPELGHRILADIRQLSKVLPIVLHHHEQWDGKGYPHGLEGEEIPLLARIAAVADAFDAMSSDRPYRKGMPMEKVESIFRDGAGKQWDAQVVDAFFASLDDILDITSRERADLTLDVQQWV